ncbi:MAG TPA: cytochrome c-type biogenesis protein [Acidobacteriota bacterium]|nr:cytochrome c-type biogenesis protein [Acidobacteriota bacterium]
MRIALMVLFLVFSSAMAHEDDVRLSPQQEVVAKSLETELIAPCCWRQPVSEHHSPAAEKVRAEIRQLVSEGQSSEAILARFTDQYGARILSAPPRQGFNWLAWVLPFVALAVGGLGIVIYVRSKQPSGEAASADQAGRSSSDDRYARMLEEEMREV